MMKKALCFCLFPLSMVYAGAQSEPGQNAKLKYPSGYWQVDYYTPQFGSVYQIGLEVKSLKAAEKTVKALALKYDATPQTNPQYQNSSTKNGVLLAYSLTGPKSQVEAFVRKIRSAGTLTQYTMNTPVNLSSLAETQKKAAALSSEISENRNFLDKMPIADFVMSDLLAKYNNYITTYGTAGKRAVIYISLNEQSAGQ